MTDDWDIRDQVSVPIVADENGFTRRECPNKTEGMKEGLVVFDVDGIHVGGAD